VGARAVTAPTRGRSSSIVDTGTAEADGVGNGSRAAIVEAEADPARAAAARRARIARRARGRRGERRGKNDPFFVIE
jgi:hypothetical protein